MALALIVVVAATVAEPHHCADYPDGHRCEPIAYGLIIVAGLGTALFIVLTVYAAISWARRRREPHPSRSVPPS